MMDAVASKVNTIQHTQNILLRGKLYFHARTFSDFDTNLLFAINQFNRSEFSYEMTLFVRHKKRVEFI